MTLEDKRLKALEEEQEAKKQAYENGQCELTDYMEASTNYRNRLNYLNSLQRTGEKSRAVTVPLYDEPYKIGQPEEVVDNNYSKAIPEYLYQLLDRSRNAFVHIRPYRDGTVHVDKEGYNTGPYESVIFDLNKIDEQQKPEVVEMILNLSLFTTGEKEFNNYNSASFGSVFYEDKSGGLYPESEFIAHQDEQIENNNSHRR